MNHLVRAPALGALLILVGAPPASASDARDDEFVEMRKMVEEFKGQVDAQAEQLEHQGRLRIYGVTGTLDYELLEQLMLRGEVRWDTVHKFQAENREFIDRGNKFAKNQVTAGVELVYTF